MNNLQEHPVFKGYFGDVEGNVYSYAKNNRKLNQVVRSGRKYIDIQHNKVRVHVCVSDFICDIFVPNENNYPCIIPIDGNKLNVSVSNLKRVSPDYYLQEEYKEHPTHKGFFITKSGEVWSSNRMRDGLMVRLNESKEKYGYYSVYVNKKHIKVHRLVSETYLSNPNNLPEVNHIDEDKSNNNLSNLEWISRKDNITHSKETIRKSHLKKWIIVEENTNNKTVVEDLTDWCEENNINKKTLYHTQPHKKNWFHKGYKLILSDKNNN